MVGSMATAFGEAIEIPPKTDAMRITNVPNAVRVCTHLDVLTFIATPFRDMREPGLQTPYNDINFNIALHALS
jgi:hypothetical protein